MRSIGKTQSSVMRFLILVLLLPVLASCTSYQENEYVTVQISNFADEDLKVETGVIFCRIVVLRGQTQCISVVKDERVSAQGVSSGHVYDSRSFTWDMNTWVIH